MMPLENEHFVMANKCLEFCQALASQGQKFSFSLNTGCNFNFSLDTKEKSTSLDTSMVSTLQQSMKKKLSPSQLMRNMKRKQDFLKLKSEKSKTVLSQQNKNPFLCNQCEYSFKLKNDLENHIENMHKVGRSSEHIEQLDGHIEVSVPLANSTCKDGFKTPNDQLNKPVKDYNDSSHALKAITPTKDGPEIEMIHKRIQELDPKMLETMSEKELSDLNAKIFRSVTCEMQLRRKPPCDISYLKLAVSKIIKKHMKA
jgi:hypothetical protein